MSPSPGRAAITLVVLILTGLFAGSASAHFIHPREPVTKMTPAQARGYYERVLHHAAYVERVGAGRSRIAHTKLAAWAQRRIDQLPPLSPMGALGLHPPHEAAWSCIHRYEGSWTDPNPPFWGGLQMDLSFQQAYGPELLAAKGTADHWTPLEQMWVAERAYRAGRGFYPWPNTARYCGLI